MGKPRTLRELARLCEEAIHPDRALDEKIAEAVGWSRPKKDGICGPTFVRRHEYEWIDALGRTRGFAPPPYTGSLDAALTLIPDGYLLDTLTDIAVNGGSGCTLTAPSGALAGVSTGAAKRNLSVAAAALRVRAS